MDLKQWYVPRGRMDRRTWWMHYTLPLAGLSLLALLADQALGLGRIGFTTTTSAASFVYEPGFFALVTSLLTVVPSIAAHVTRLHDRNMPAWWLLLAFIPVVGGLGLFVLLAFVPGNPGPNRYGPPPGQPAGWQAPGQAPPAWGQPQQGWGQPQQGWGPPAAGPSTTPSWSPQPSAGAQPPLGPEDDPDWGRPRT